MPPIVAVARDLRVTADTVRKWRRRFLAERLAGPADEPRPGRPPNVSIDQVEAVVVTTLEQLPKNATHRSRTWMAQHSGLSSGRGRVWRQFQLKPHLADTFKLSTDPLFVEKVYDVVGLYFNPPEGAVVLSVDEKSQIQALDRSRGEADQRGGQAGRFRRRLDPVEVDVAVNRSAGACMVGVSVTCFMAPVLDPCSGKGRPAPPRSHAGGLPLRQRRRGRGCRPAHERLRPVREAPGPWR
ncbi:helix-turn-helix domain-containing protein [Streptomyces sp. WG7]|uniref:helix-turn-helix domain-containing protein n=1 Tax=Streptomyces sp. WG7 TaxID=3417650 RepID=UPI003CF67716